MRAQRRIVRQPRRGLGQNPPVEFPLPLLLPQFAENRRVRPPLLLVPGLQIAKLLPLFLQPLPKPPTLVGFGTSSAERDPSSFALLLRRL